MQLDYSSITPAEFELQEPSTLVCRGDWTQRGIIEIQKRIFAFKRPKSAKNLIVQGKDIANLDMAGAWLLCKLQIVIQKAGIECEFQDFDEEHQKLLQLILKQGPLKEPKIPQGQHGFALIGQHAVLGWNEALRFFSFAGELCFVALNVAKGRGRVRFKSLLHGIEMTGYNAILIVSLLSFLIGVVLAYQIGVQLSEYGASIYVVDLLGLSVLREFGPLVTAIIVAGRTGSAYTAQLGTMNLRQEVDALKTMGLSPAELLVLPRVLALVITLPLLSVLADIFGIMGGMLMAKSSLGIGYIDFLHRFGQVIELKQYILGLLKTPVFAVLIATIGCFQGFQVTGSAESVGSHTTRSVVQGIFMIMTADAAFSIIYTWMGV